VSGLGGEDSGVLELNAVAQVDAVLGHGEIVWKLQTDVALVLLDPGFDGTAGLTDVDLTTLAGHAVHPRSPRSSFTGQRKLGIFFGGRPTDLMLCLDSSLLMRLRVVLMKGRKATKAGFSGGGATLATGLRACWICQSL
jgi:hypothetical protein